MGESVHEVYNHDTWNDLRPADCIIGSVCKKVDKSQPHGVKRYSSRPGETVTAEQVSRQVIVARLICNKDVWAVSIPLPGCIEPEKKTQNRDGVQRPKINALRTPGYPVIFSAEYERLHSFTEKRHTYSSRNKQNQDTYSPHSKSPPQRKSIPCLLII
jgi:hypothetical protein